jgi:hypothetical protein
LLTKIISVDKDLSFQIGIVGSGNNITCFFAYVNTTLKGHLHKCQITQRCNFSRNFPIFSNQHCQHRKQYLLFFQLYKDHFKGPFAHIKSFCNAISVENLPSDEITTANGGGNIYCFLACVNTTSKGNLHKGVKSLSKAISV